MYIFEKAIEYISFRFREFRSSRVTIDIQDAIKRDMEHKCNIYGDSINKLKCRSLWIDKSGIIWRVKQLKEDE